jgi:hypothetical protein
MPAVPPVQQRQERVARCCRIAVNRRPRPQADRDERHPWQRAQALLRCGDANVWLPVIGVERHATDCGHAVDQGPDTMGSRNRADARAVVERARRGLAVHEAQQFDLRMRVEISLNVIGVGRLVVGNAELMQFGAGAL